MKPSRRGPARYRRSALIDAIGRRFGVIAHVRTLIYADYAPSAREAEWVEAAFSAPSSAAGAAPLAEVA